MQALRGRRHRVTELLFSPCGRWLAAAGSYGGVDVWDTLNPNDKPSHTPLSGAGGGYWSGLLAFRPDGKLFCCNARYHWFLFDWAAHTLIELATPTQHGRFTPSPDGTTAVLADDRNPFECWTIPAEGPPAQKWTTKNQSWMHAAAAFSPDGSAVACAEWRNSKRAVIVRDTATGETRHELPLPATSVTHLAFAPGGLIVGTSTASLLCWDLAEPTKAPKKAGNPSRRHFQAMTVHPAGPVLTLDNDRLVRVWDAATVNPYRAIEWNIGKLYAGAVSPDGARAAVGSHTGRVLVWDWD
jgi:WD40 repeat protein